MQAQTVHLCRLLMAHEWTIIYVKGTADVLEQHRPIINNEYASSILKMFMKCNRGLDRCKLSNSSDTNRDHCHSLLL